MTEKITHTPGPWIANGVYSRGSQYGIFDIQTNDGHRVAEFRIAQSIKRADIRLMAAAPELLAALKAIVGNGGTATNAMHLDAVAAISKAES